MRRIRVYGDEYMPERIDYRKEEYMRDPELREAYECGRKDGWREAMRESREQGGYDERTIHYPSGRISYREEDDDMDYRRRRDSRGRFV